MDGGLTIRYLFLYSLKDPAGVNMANYLMSRLRFDEGHDFNGLYIRKCGEYGLAAVDQDIIYTDYIDSKIPYNIDTIIFLSRHSSIKEYPTLSVHVTGNPLEDASYGGKPYSLAKSNPSLMKSILKWMSILRDERGLKYDVRMEVTHHGPTEVKSKVVFVEVGSTIKQWNDLEATNTVVDSVLNALKNIRGYKPAVGFGGPHYAPLFTKIMLEEEYAIGHIFSKYVLNHDIKPDIILKAFKLSDDSKTAVLDWKSIKGGVRQWLRSFLSEYGFEVIKR